jgi:hypothetical protein
MSKNSDSKTQQPTLTTPTRQPHRQDAPCVVIDATSIAIPAGGNL